MTTEHVWCVACGKTIGPETNGDYRYCAMCADGPFCAACDIEHECQESDDEA